MTEIKTCVDGYNLRLIIVGVKITATMARWYAVAYRCHARLTPTLLNLAVKHIYQIYPIGRRVNDPQDGEFIYIYILPPPQSDIKSRLRVGAVHICHTQSVNAINVNIVWFVEHACTNLITYISCFTLLL